MNPIHHVLNSPLADFYTFLPAYGLLTKHFFLLVLTALLLIFILRLAASKIQNPREIPSGRFYHTIESVVVYIREEMVYAIMGKKYGKTYLPFFLSIFFLILTANLIGLIPEIPGIFPSASSMANISITGGLASLVFIVGVIGGLKEQGPLRFFKSIVPHGIPILLLPLLYVLETFGMIVKHSVLAIRLFANMIAGHLVIFAILGMILMFKGMMPMWYLIAPAPILLATAIYFLEFLVAFLQAYVFTLLAIIFVGSFVHPSH